MLGLMLNQLSKGAPWLFQGPTGQTGAWNRLDTTSVDKQGNNRVPPREINVAM